MYIAGTISDFTSRAHQLPKTQGDFDAFIAEGNGYAATAPPSLIAQWDRILGYAKFSALKDTGYILAPPISVLTPLLDTNGNVILDVNGHPIFGV